MGGIKEVYTLLNNKLIASGQEPIAYTTVVEALNGTFRRLDVEQTAIEYMAAICDDVKKVRASNTKSITKSRKSNKML